MRGTQDRQVSMLTLISIEARIPSDHPLRRIKRMADQELLKLSAVFNRMYSQVGRPSVAPETILKSLLLIALYSVRSERQFCEQLGYNLLFRWFLDMELEEESFDATVFSKNRERLMEHEVGRLFFDAVVRQARGAGLMSDDHFTVDGTLIEAWARALRVFGPRVKKDREITIRAMGATAGWIFTVRSAATTPMSRAPILTVF
jgi:transposase